MARGSGKRTYARDNRGRFASTGATARGGRLRTAAGNKRKTVTTRLVPAKTEGTIGKKRRSKASIASKPTLKERPALRPGSFKESPIKAYVESVRLARQNTKNTPKHTTKKEAQQEYRLQRKSLSLRIMRERGIRKGLKPQSFLEAITGKQ